MIATVRPAGWVFWQVIAVISRVISNKILLVLAYIIVVTLMKISLVKLTTTIQLHLL